MGQSATMASKSAQFFENGTNKQFEFVFSKYQEALQAKADSKNSKSEILIKLDKWYQNELPKKIKSRGKEAHLTHEEIVQTIKWKLARGQFRPRLKDLIQMNTPRVVMQESKKAFRAIDKKKDLEASARWCQECSPRSTVFHQMPRQRMLSPTCLLMGSLSSLLQRRTWLSNKNEEYDLKIDNVNQRIINHHSFHV